MRASTSASATTVDFPEFEDIWQAVLFIDDCLHNYSSNSAGLIILF